jgi:FAD/FMN-containing dehydrogenase
LTHYNTIHLDIDAQTATIQAGVLTKPLNQAVHEAGFCLQSSGAASVGHIPFVLDGGQSWLTGIYGMAVDQMISARVVTATNGLVVASETENVDLFWALKGAGQFFGLVTEITVRIFSFRREILSWSCIFLPTQVKEVGKALEVVSNGNIVKSPGMVAIMRPPGQDKVRIFSIVNAVDLRYVLFK